MAERVIGLPFDSLQAAIGLITAAERGEVAPRVVYRGALTAIKPLATANGQQLAAIREKMLRTADPETTRGLREEFRNLTFDAERLGEAINALTHLLENVAPEHERQRKAALNAAKAKRKALASQVAELHALMAHIAHVLRDFRESEAEIAKLGGVPVSAWTGDAMPLQGGDDGAPPLALYDVAGRALDLGPSSLMTMPSVGDRVKLEATVDTGIPPALPAGLPIRLAAGEAVVATLGLDGAAMLASARGLKIWRVGD